MENRTLTIRESAQFKIRNLMFKLDNQILTITGNSGSIFGMGERFDAIDVNNQTIENKVLEKFCHQEKNTYLPLPFFMFSDGVGVFIQTERVFSAHFNAPVTIDLTPCESECKLWFFEGTGKEIISDYIGRTNDILLPPKWAFGPWLSGHRWNSEKLVNEQILLSEEHKIPYTTLVIEQWSDEATFYIFNQAHYVPQSEALNYEDFSFDQNSKWPDPKGMFERWHQKGIHTLLWQAPVIKELETHEPENKQNQIDHRDAITHGYMIKTQEGSPYRVPKGHWFPGSLIPDFTNPNTKKWWFSKHQYLLDIGVDGFKTDGGEFIYDMESTFHNGKRGYDLINRYSALTIQSYREFVGPNRALFSRAGYIGQQSTTIHWAGDQKSEWSEFRAIYNAGLSASLSGQAFWSFDIGGFAGDLPSIELYRRSTQMAVFTPIMQLHSEPVGGQFALLDASKVMKNDRTPWNIANYHNNIQFIPEIRTYYRLRMNLLPSIYSWSCECVQSKMTLMKHMWVAFPNEYNAHAYHEQYLFGHLLVAPLLYENQKEKTVYFPNGQWRHLLTNQKFTGGSAHNFEVSELDWFVFVQDGHALFLNLGSSNHLMESDMDNTIHTPTVLTVWLYGNSGEDRFQDESNKFTIRWDNHHYTIIGECNLTLDVKYLD